MNIAYSGNDNPLEPITAVSISVTYVSTLLEMIC